MKHCKLLLMLVALIGFTAIPHALTAPRLIEWEGGSALVCCFYNAEYRAQTTITLINQHGGPLPVTGVIVIDGSYCPSRQRLDFSVQVTYSNDSGCTSSFAIANGSIGPFGFEMTTTTMYIGGGSYPVTHTSGSPLWATSGSITSVSNFDCTTWTIAPPQAPLVLANGTACAETQSVNFNIDPVAAVGFSCTCQ